MIVGRGISRLGDFSSGHDCYLPTIGARASRNVYVNKLPAHKVGDRMVPHFCKTGHADVMAKGSTTVRVNKTGVMRVGDVLAPGGAVMTQGSHNVLSG